MTLPFSRNTTYTPGSPIYSVDLNAIQDSIITCKRGEFYGRMSLTPYFQIGWTVPSAGLVPWLQSNATTNEAWFALGIESGDQFRGLRWDSWGASGGTLNIIAYCNDEATIGTGSGQVYQSNANVVPNGVWTKYRADGTATNFGANLFFSQITAGDSDIAVVKFVASTVGQRITNVRPVLARP